MFSTSHHDEIWHLQDWMGLQIKSRLFFHSADGSVQSHFSCLSSYKFPVHVLYLA